MPGDNDPRKNKDGDCGCSGPTESQQSQRRDDQGGTQQPGGEKRGRDGLGVPGRPDTDQERDRNKTYEPGGGRPEAQKDSRGGAQQHTNVDEPERDRGEVDTTRNRTGQGADTEPM